MFNTHHLSNTSLAPWRAGSLRPNHTQLLWLYMIIVFGHWLEHLTQIYQIYVLGWTPQEAGGVLGLWLPQLAASEVLHFTYNFVLFAGLLLLAAGFGGRARFWWRVTIGAQGWHLFEHTLLQIQWLTSYYLFGAVQQIGIGQLWIPRAELHFLYNLIVFAPMVIAMIAHFHQWEQEALR